MPEGSGHVAPATTQPPSLPPSEPTGRIDIQDFDLPIDASNPSKRAPVESSDSLEEPLDLERPAKRRRLSTQTPGNIAAPPSPETKTPELSAGEERMPTSGSKDLTSGEKKSEPQSPSTAPPSTPNTNALEPSTWETGPSTDGSEGNAMLTSGEENPEPVSPSSHHLVSLFTPSGLYKSHRRRRYSH